MNPAIKLAAIAAIAIGAPMQASAQTYKDPSASPVERAKSIVAEMTLDEKVAMMRFESPAIPRLGIKQYNWWNEALHGVARAGLATVFPQPIGMAASFDDRLVYDVFSAVSTEARAKNNDWRRRGPINIYQGLTFWTPNVNIFRDPRWGRGHETYGEDPYLMSVMGKSVVRGLQGDNFEGGAYTGPDAKKHYKLHACAKHYAVHSGPEWSRHVYDAKDISQRDLWETYLPAFHALVTDAGVKEVMCAYNRFEGEPCCGSNRLLNTILREEWDYDNVILTDCWAMNDFFTKGAHNTEPDAVHAVAKAVRTGTDLECGHSFGALVDAVKKGLVTEDEINRSVIRLMTARYQLGEMDDDALVEWTSIPMSVVNCAEHRALADRIARESIVLLKNDGVLPLKDGIKVAVLGPNANDSVMQWGNYNGLPNHTSTLLSALRERLGNSAVIYDPACDHTSEVALMSLMDQTVAPSGQKGLDVKYWNKVSDANSYKTAPDVLHHYGSSIALTTAGATVFAPGVPLGRFTGLYETTLIPEESGTVTFRLQVIGYATLWINGKKVFYGGNMKGNVYSLDVKKGKKYRIKLSYRATEGDTAALSFDFGTPMPIDVSGTIAAAKDADVIVFAGGISPQLEGEEMPVRIPGFRGGDREDIELPAVQTRMLRELAKTGKPIVYVNFSGSAIALTEQEPLVDAIVQAWYPGEAGGKAIVDVLFGDYNPSGRLPVTFYAKSSDLPDIEDYNMTDRTYRYFRGKPLYPFGFGLSYTDFVYGDATVSRVGDNVRLSVPLTNAGERDGEEVVQVYLSRPADADGPVRSLRAFRRVPLQAGESTMVDIDLSPEQFAWFDPAVGRMVPQQGEYIIEYGSSSAAESLRPIPVSR